MFRLVLVPRKVFNTIITILTAQHKHFFGKFIITITFIPFVLYRQFDLFKYNTSHMASMVDLLYALFAMAKNEEVVH